MRRAVSAVLAFLMLPFILSASAESVPDEAESLRAFLQSHYGVTILMGDEISLFPSEIYALRIIPEGESVFLQTLAGNERFADLLRCMDDVFSVYPPEFFSRFAKKDYIKGLRFILTDQILLDGTRISSVQSVHDRHIDVYLAKDDAKERAIHHEIWHAMEYRILCEDPGAFDGWPSLNPEGFVYTGDFSVIRNGEEKQEPEDWFASEYGKIDEFEDRATVFEALMIRDEIWWSARPHLQKKAEYLLDIAKPIFGEIFTGE